MTSVDSPRTRRLQLAIVVTLAVISGGAALVLTAYNIWRMLAEPGTYDRVFVGATGLLILLAPPTLLLGRFMRPQAPLGTKLQVGFVLVLFAAMYLFVVQDWLQIHAGGSWAGAATFVLFAFIPAGLVKGIQDTFGTSGNPAKQEGEQA